MTSQSPAPWTFAARAAYFGDRVCAFCHHHNPAGARFCNECASPLQLKPCNRCDAVNDQAATSCHNCGAAFPVALRRSEAIAVSPAAAPTPACTTPAEVTAATPVTQRVTVASALAAYWRSVRPGQFLLTAVVTIAIAGGYAVHHLNGSATPAAIEVASQPIAAPAIRAPAATPAMPITAEPKLAEPKPEEPDTQAALQSPPPAIHTETPKSASAGPPAPVPATKRASAHPRPAPARTSVAAPRLAQSRTATGFRASVAGLRKTPRTDTWHAMHVSLARCSGDLIARIVCDQRTRQRFCAGHWGKAAECASFTNEHGQ